MRTKLLIALALVVAITALAGCGGASVDAARAAVPRIRPAPHPPLRPPVHIPDPPEPRVHIPPLDNAARFEALKAQQVRQLERRYQQVSGLISYACRAKQIFDLSQAETVEDAVKQVVLDAGGSATLELKLELLVQDLQDQSFIDQIHHAAVFAFCDARL